ncbi:ATP-binding cassette domain-containing protein [Spiroplasma floricola]|uniref:ABC transporter ATP-binding protein n=1 Tax=Spiroplasma floricola 23-6 TaxID=1336749 RepID=A0A2K8SEC9_9MOLU|nr:ABC transporter ATP-binding protein [Spiroplasma floricola]AUB31782.1 ABC transporter ATP-binding protein [Spiroplasma floricola 23-6]
METTVINFQDFKKKFKKTQIGPIDLEIKAGKITALCGRSGSGKSVILNSIIGAIKKYKGNIFFNSVNRRKRRSYLQNSLFGFYTQMDFSLYDISAYSFLKLICLSFNIEKNKIKEEIEYWMTYFGLWEERNKKVKNFSWGMKNRMNLIMCFIKRAEIIILDEPGANLDSYWRNKIKNLLKEHKKMGKTVIITAHNIDEIWDIIDDYIILEEGQKIFQGSQKELNIYNKYKLFLDKKFSVEKFKDFLKEKNIKSFRYNEDENSIVFATNSLKEINWIFLYFIGLANPILNLVKLPINMESINKAIEDNQNNKTKIKS